MKQETRSLRFLYETKIGRCCLKVLIQPWISKAVGAFLSTGLSRPMVGHFINKNQIDMTPYPQKKYRSFNDFFTRKRQNKIDDSDFVSPCDAYLSAYPIDRNSTYHIKHIDYCLSELLGDDALAQRYEGGTCLIFRLTPQHYHRYCFSVDGRIETAKRLDGKLHCVRPIAYTATPVFAQNSREYVVIDTEQFGKIVQMEVGALLVGKISNHLTEGIAHRGSEKGYFEFGGSTIILLLEKERLKLAPTLNTSAEKDVHYGQKLSQ